MPVSNHPTQAGQNKQTALDQYESDQLLCVHTIIHNKALLRPLDINWRDAELSFMPRAKSHISTN